MPGRRRWKMFEGPSRCKYSRRKAFAGKEIRSLHGEDQHTQQYIHSLRVVVKHPEISIISPL